MNITTTFLASAVLAASVSPVFAAGFASSTGTGAPPASLGPYTLTPFSVDYDDPRTGFVPDVPSPLGGTLLFSEAMEILTVGDTWGTWSHGFSGDVYAVDLNLPSPFAVTLDLPASTSAFLFYAQPSPLGFFDVSAVLDDGTMLTQSVDGDGGAAGFGFWAAPGGSLVSITVSSEFDYALGEFSIAGVVVPESGTFAVGLMALGLVGIPLVHRWSARRSPGSFASRPR